MDNEISNFGYIKKGHVGVEQLNSFFRNSFLNAKKFIKAIAGKKRKKATNVRHKLNDAAFHDVSTLALIFV